MNVIIVFKRKKLQRRHCLLKCAGKQGSSSAHRWLLRSGTNLLQKVNLLPIIPRGGGARWCLLVVSVMHVTSLTAVWLLTVSLRRLAGPTAVVHGARKQMKGWKNQRKRDGVWKAVIRLQQILLGSVQLGGINKRGFFSPAVMSSSHHLHPHAYSAATSEHFVSYIRSVDIQYAYRPEMTRWPDFSCKSAPRRIQASAAPLRHPSAFNKLLIGSLDV